MVSIIITSRKEPKTIGRAVRFILEQVNDVEENVELVLVCPDEETKLAAEKVVKELNFRNFRWLRDKGKGRIGKPAALNFALKQIKSDIWIFTDGDVYFEKGALKHLLKHFKDKKVGGVAGRPRSMDPKNNKWGYWGHLLADAAHQKRSETLGKRGFFPVSGYIFAMRKMKVKIPDGALDDVYFSYKIIESDYKIAYEPKAIAYMKQPANVNDWLKQKVRSMAGYQRLQTQATFINVARKHEVIRSFWHDLQYFLFPLKYAKNAQELPWSIELYLLRLWMWLKVWWEVNVKKRTAKELWHRVESTK